MRPLKACRRSEGLPFQGGCLQPSFLVLATSYRKVAVGMSVARQFLVGDNKNLKDIMAVGYCTARKHYDSFTCIILSIMDIDLFDAAGQIIFSNSATKLYLESGDFEKARQNRKRCIECTLPGWKAITAIDDWQRELRKPCQRYSLLPEHADLVMAISQREVYHDVSP